MNAIHICWEYRCSICCCHVGIVLAVLEITVTHFIGRGITDGKRFVT